MNQRCWNPKCKVKDMCMFVKPHDYENHLCGHNGDCKMRHLEKYGQPCSSCKGCISEFEWAVLDNLEKNKK